MKTLAEKLLVIAATAMAMNGAMAASTIYIPLGATGQVQVVDAATNRIVGMIEEVGNAHGLAITPDGRYLVAGSFNEAEGDAADTLPRPADVSEAEHAKHHAKPAPSESATAGTSYVSVIDTTSQKVVRRIAVRGAVHHVAVSPDGRFAVTTHPGTGGVSVVDLEDFEVAATVTTGAAPNYAVFSRDGRNVYVSNAGDNAVSDIDVATWSVTRRITTGGGPEHVVLAPDGETLYVNNVTDGTASAIALAEGRVTQTFLIGSAPHGIDVSDDGATLFASIKGENTLVAIDTGTGKTRQIELAPAPYHVAAVRGSGTLYVSSRAENRIWVIDQKSLARTGEVAIGGIGHQMAVAGP